MSELPNKLRWWALDALTVGHLRADLLAAADAIEAVEWRGIESAPRDSSDVELMFDDGSTDRCWWTGMMGWEVRRVIPSSVRKPIKWRPLPVPPEARP